MTTSDYAGQHELTTKQQNAIDLLILGKSDTETAEEVGVHRVTISKWRLYSPQFRAELNKRRAALWGAAQDRLRSLLPKALGALGNELDGGLHAVKAAVAILKLGRIAEAAPDFGPTEASEIIADVVEQRTRQKQEERERFSDPTESVLRSLMSTEQRRAKYAADREAAIEEVLSELSNTLAGDEGDEGGNANNAAE